MNLELILEEQNSVCEQACQLIVEENSLLKTTGQPPDGGFLEKKRALLFRLDASLNALKTHATTHRAEIQKHRPVIEKVQQLILRTLLLDRENEQLLLKCTMAPRRAPVQQFKPSVNHLQKIYQRHSGGGGN